MKTNTKKLLGGGAKQSSKLLAAMAVLAVAFVVLAAVPAAVTNSDADGAVGSDATLYVDGTKGDDTNNTGAEDSPLKTIATALTGSQVKTIVLLSNPADTGTINVTKAVTIESDRTTVKDAMYKIGVKISASAGLTLKNVEVAPTLDTDKNDVAITVTGGALKIDGCKITISGTDGYRADGIIANSKSVTSVAVTGTELINANNTSYTRGMFISGVATVTLTGNTATGLHVFAATSGVSTSLTVTGNESTDMTGDFTTEGETKDSKFLQIAGTNAGTITVTKNTVSPKDGYTGEIPVLNVHDSTVSVNGELTVEGFMKVTGVFTGGNATVDGDILVQDLDKSTTQASMTISKSKTFTVGEFGSLTVAAGSSLTINGTVALSENAGLMFAAPGKDDTDYSYLNAASDAKIILNNGAELTIADLAWAYDNEKNVKTHQSFTGTAAGSVAITFEAGVETGQIAKAKIAVAEGAKTGSLTITDGVFPAIPGAVIGIETAVSGDIVLMSLSSTKAKLEISGNGVYSGTITQAEYTWTNDTGEGAYGSATVGATAELTNIAAASGRTVTIAAGSIVLTGEMTADQANAEIAAGTGNIELGENFKLTSGTLKLEGTVTVVDDVEVSSGATLEIAKGATVNVATGKTIKADGTLSISGTVTQAADSEEKAITGTGTVEVNAGADITGVEIADTVVAEIDDSVMKEKRESGEVSTGSTTYPANQIVVIDGTWTLVPGAIVTIQGKLSVPEGAKVIIEEGASLTLIGGAVAEIEGSIEVREEADGYTPGAFTVTTGTAKINGNAVVNGTLSVGAAGKVEIGQDAILTIGEEGTLTYAAGGEITVKASGALVMNGGITADVEIDNYGTVTIDSDTDAEEKITVNQKADGAVVDIVKFSLNASKADDAYITVTDAAMEFASYKATDGSTAYVENTNENNKLEIKATLSDSNLSYYDLTIGGIEVVSKASSVSKTDSDTEDADEGIYNGKKWTKVMDISGILDSDIALSETGSTNSATLPTSPTNRVTATLTGTYVADSATRAYATVAGSLVVADENTFTFAAKARMIVTGSVSTESSSAAFTNTAGSIAVQDDGEIVTYSSTILSNIESVYYVVSGTGTSGSTVKAYHYVTIDNALAYVNGNTDADKITVLGNQTVETDGVLPTGATLEFKSGKVTIGSSTSTSTVLTVAAGATVNGTVDIDVKGTLYAQDKTDVKSTSGIVSDVYTEEVDENGKAVKKGWAQWTNLTSAIESGAETITISKTTGTVDIASNLTIPAGVTVIVPADTAALNLKNGVVLTIDGTLQTSKDITAESRFAVNAMNVTGYKSSAIVVNGELMIADTLDVEVGDGNDATAPESLIASVPIYGAYYSIDDWTVISTIDAALAETDITSAIEVYGPVKGSDGTVTANTLGFSGIVVTDVEFTPNMLNGSSNKVSTALTMNSLTLGSGTSIDMTGAFTGSVVVGENSAAFTAIEGVTAANSSDALVLTGSEISVGTGQSLSVSAGTVSLGAFTVTSGTVKIASGATAKVDGAVDIAKLDVAGTFEVPAGKSAKVDELIVTGTVSVTESTSTTTGGSLTIGTAYVGISKSDFYSSTAAAASVNGPFTLTGKMFVASGATIDQDMSSYAKTEVYNGGSLWFTAYASGTQTMVLNKAPLTNAVLSGWAKTEGGNLAYDADDEITIGDASKLYSVVKTEIYTVLIKADEGIDNVYLDGNLMSYGLYVDSEAGVVYYAYTATVAAGTYTVKCTLKNGYSGDAKLALVDAGSVTASVSGTSVTVSGSEGKATFQLTGVEKSGYVDPVEQKDDGLTVTDYLLIVLVILVVILAVIVAMRLMRS